MTPRERLRLHLGNCKLCGPMPAGEVAAECQEGQQLLQPSRERLLAHLMAEPFCNVQDTFFRVYGIHAKEAMAQKIASVPDEWLVQLLLAEFESVDAGGVK